MSRLRRPPGRRRSSGGWLAAALAIGALSGPVVQAQVPGAPAQPTDSARRTSVARDSVVTPRADQARGVDAEVRIAVYELLGNQLIPALGRLEHLNSSPVALSGAAVGALRGRDELLFLTAQTYYRLGMDSAFRRTAESILAGSGAARFGSVLRAQLLLEAYRGGDFARASTLAKAVTGAELRGLAPLVGGLAAYQLRSYPEARISFAAAQQGGPPYAAYARYMDALTMLRGDTAQTGPVLQALTALAQSTTGEFADQVRLTAAELAYESEQFDQAGQLAGAIAPTSGLGAQALLTRAWALYKANQIGPSGEAFADFATRFPQLPERDETRLMSAQALLQRGLTNEAALIFRTVADSASSEARSLQSRSGTVMGEAARSLVAARAPGLLFITDPMNGKTVALQDDAGADVRVFGSVVSDAPPAASIDAKAPEVISIQDVAAQVAAFGAQLGTGFPTRLLFTQTSATMDRAEYARRSQTLAGADAAVALARYRLQQLLDANALQVATMKALQQLLTDQAATFGTLESQLKLTQDSLARMVVALDAASARLRQIMTAQINSARLVANENVAMIDSVRRMLGSTPDAREAQLLAIEAEIAATYRRVADAIDSGLNGALSRLPVFALRDSVRLRGERLVALLAETKGIVSSTQVLVAAELARLERDLPSRSAPFRQALAAGESRRTAAEGRLVALVESELNARAGEMLTVLRRDTEAAEFGSASAAFFRAIDAGRGISTGASGAAGGASAEAASTTSPAPNAGAPNAAVPTTRARPQDE